MKAITSLFFTALLSYSLTSGAAALSNPDGFSTICTLDESCSVDGSTLVAFGADGDFSYKTLSGNFLCSAPAFGLDKSKNVANATCSILDPEVSSGIITPSSSSSAETESSAAAVQNSGLYAIVSRSSGKALTISDASDDDGARVVQQNFTQANNQIWSVTDLGNGYFSLSALHSNKALETKEWDSRDGSGLQQLTWMNSWNQQWALQDVGEGFVRIVSRTNGQVMDVYEMNNKNNGEVVLWTYWGGENQHWRLVPVNSPDEKLQP